MSEFKEEVYAYMKTLKKNIRQDDLTKHFFQYETEKTPVTKIKQKVRMRISRAINVLFKENRIKPSTEKHKVPHIAGKIDTNLWDVVL